MNCIPDNYDTEDSRHYDHLFASRLANCTIDGRVATVAGLRIAGLGRMFRSNTSPRPFAEVFHHKLPCL